MCINFDVVIESPENSVDMKAGLDTLQGASEATRYVAETFLWIVSPRDIHITIQSSD